MQGGDNEGGEATPHNGSECVEEPVSYKEYEESWDLEDQSKKCRRAVNCLLASCKSRGEGEAIREEEGDLPVHLSASGETETGGRAGT